MLNLELARKYSTAMFEIAQDDDKLVEYGKELTDVQQDFAAAPQLMSYLANPMIQREDKKALLRKAYEGELTPVVLNFLLLLVDKRRIELLPAIEEQYKALSNKARGIAIADVTTAGAFSADQQTALAKKLADLTGKTVSLRLHKEPSLIGGIVVQIGDRRIDGSVKGRLSSMAEELLAE